MTDHQNDKKTEQITYWLDIAQYDFETAEALLVSGRFLYVGFMCHQTVEKTFKAFYVKNCNVNPPFSHNLSLLAKESGIFPRFTEEQKQFIATIQPMNIEARYPTYKDKIFKVLDHERCKSLILNTKEFCQWLRNQC